MTGDRLPEENRILKVEGESRTGSVSFTVKRRDCGGGGGDGGGGGGAEMGFEAGQHQELSGDTMVGGSSLRL